MKTGLQGRLTATNRWLALGLTCMVLIGCVPIPVEEGDFDWPEGPTAMAIWATQPATGLVLGLDGESLTIRWNDTELEGTHPTVSVQLDATDPNKGAHTLAAGLDAVADGAADEWLFDGRDTDGNYVPPAVYNVTCTIDDGAGNTKSDQPDGTFTVPLKFTVPKADISIFQTAGLSIEWEVQVFGGARLDVGLNSNLTAPDDANSLVWVSDPNGALFGTQVTSLQFDGTVWDKTTLEDGEANSSTIVPDTYVIVARITPIGTGGIPFFVRSKAKVVVLVDP